MLAPPCTRERLVPNSKTFHIDPAGPPLTLVLLNGHANDGTYYFAVVLKGAHAPSEEHPAVGQPPLNFSSPGADTYTLADAPSTLDGATLYFSAVVGLFAAGDPYDTFCEVRQNGQLVGQLGEANDKAGKTLVRIEDQAAFSTGAAPTVAFAFKAVKASTLPARGGA
jgi:hypothetical protein